MSTGGGPTANHRGASLAVGTDRLRSAAPGQQAAPLRHGGRRIRCQRGTAMPIPMMGVLWCGVAREHVRREG